MKVAIIGAGASGLTSAVAALEAGIVPILFEMSPRIGGVWGPDDRGASDTGSAWPGMKVNISRHTGVFSNFDWPDNAPDFPTTAQMYQYLCDYAQHFSVLPRVQFNSQVVKVEQESKGWRISWKNSHAQIKSECFDFLLVAASKFTQPYIPDFNGLENLTKNRLHSAKFRSAANFAKQKVLIIGGSISGTAIAEALSQTTQVLHLLRKPRWMIKSYRTVDSEHNRPLLPRDLLLSYAKAKIPLSSEEQYQALLVQCAEQNEFPEWKMESHFTNEFVLGDQYFHQVRKGTLIPIRGDVNYFDKHAVVLQDGRRFDFDCVIFCTGYKRNLCFLPQTLQETVLYEDTFPLNVPGIAFIGMYPGARGAVFPLIELQARLSCAVFSNQVSLPSIATMQAEIAKHPLRDQITFANALAQRLGVLPDLSLHDIETQLFLLHGPFTPARFRLNGPHSNKAAALASLAKTKAYFQMS